MPHFVPRDLTNAAREALPATSHRHRARMEEVVMAGLRKSKSGAVPWTPRPLTPKQLKAIDPGRAAIRRGDYVTLE